MINRIKALTTRKHYINGQWIKGQGPSFSSINPADNSLLYEATQATDLEVALAYHAAHLALAEWAQRAATDRAHYMQQFGLQVEKKRHELAELISLETGKPLWESVTEVNSVIAKIKLSIQAHLERNAEKQLTSPDANGYLRYKPQGVVAVLGPFNFPAHLSNGHIVPALLAGNTVIYKPSELTPLVAAFIMQCLHESNLPAGVINALQGGVDVATSLLKQDIQGVYFTGSYHTGVKINQAFSTRPEVILALEMGGNNPLIIDAFKNTDAALYQTILSAYISAGQRCTCARRILIANNKAGDEFLKQFIHASKRLAIGAYTSNPEPFMGPVISHAHALSHLRSQQSLIDAGGRALLEMSLLTKNTGFLSPGIIDMSQVENPADEEIFAPLVQIYRYTHFSDALELANQTRYGLAAGLLSDNKERYQQFYQTIRAGLINWNKSTTGALSSLPFGGIGRSGNHRPSGYFASDYCAYPIASLEQPSLTLPTELVPGILLKARGNDGL